ncbi:putative kinase [Thermoplasmatales archaeon]|nr:putative kinase [Thermoplasmatales archaeon]
MICISGIPGTGKSTLCRKLNEIGIKCISANDEAARLDCISGDEVDVDLLRSRMDRINIVEGHYSHLLDCDAVIILTAPEATIRKRLTERGYSEAKIDDNIESMLAGTIYYEALDRMPASRIFIIDTGSADENSVLTEAERIISQMKANNKS